MTPEFWQKIKQLCELALEREADQRAAFVAESCGGDTGLQREVEAMIAQATSGGILDGPVWERLGVADIVPRMIGRYRVVRLVGEGGMGAVYEAEQDQPHRTVALKVIKPGLASPELLRRFAQESQALGRLQHSGIAQIYEAGTADTGFGPQPYFAMEFIRGESLRDYATAHHLDIRQRLELIVKVCEAVHHAHQRGLIHRDLKPGNILVDETGQPKILDFGVARVTDSDAQATRQTDLGQLVGTLAYMSPEQVLADPSALDTRSDVYALGVILYELLARRLPYTVSHKLHEAVQTIQEEDPARLSSIDRNYRGDIETIVAKALEKDKARRYASAADLAADIRRYLEDEPITARPASASYQLQKFARRHKALVGGLAAVFVVLVAGIAASTWEAVRARRAEQAAVTAQQQAKAVNDFLQNDLLAQASADAQAGPNTKPDPDLKVRTALDRAAARVEGKFAKQPLIEASIRQTIGTTYTDLGLYPEAERQLLRALELRRRALGEQHPDTLGVMNSLGQVYWSEGKYPQAEALYSKALEIGRRVQGEEHPDTVGVLVSLGLVYRAEGKYPQAEAVYTRALEIRRRVTLKDSLDTATIMGNLGALYRTEGKYGQAEPLLSKDLEIRRRLSGEEHPETLLVMSQLALVYLYQEKYGQAEALLSKAVAIRRRVSGREHPYTISAMSNLAQVYLLQGKYPEAEALDAEAVEIARRTQGAGNPNTMRFMNNLAGVYRSEGKYAQAEALYIKALELRLGVWGDEHPETLSLKYNLARIYERENRYAEAESILAKTAEVRRRVLGEKQTATVDALTLLGQVRLKQGKYGEAETALRPALRANEENRPDSWQRYNCQSLLGASLAGQKKFAEAEPLLLSAYSALDQRAPAIPAEERSSLEEARKAILQVYQAWEKPDKAAEWRQKLAVAR